MPLPVSANAVKQLGLRIARGAGQMSDEDSELLNQVILAYVEPSAMVQAEIGTPASSCSRRRSSPTVELR